MKANVNTVYSVRTYSLSTFYCATQICIARTCYGDVAGWLAGWVSVTRRYCIKTAKSIVTSTSIQ